MQRLFRLSFEISKSTAFDLPTRGIVPELLSLTHVVEEIPSHVCDIVVPGPKLGVAMPPCTSHVLSFVRSDRDRYVECSSQIRSYDESASVEEESIRIVAESTRRAYALVRSSQL